MLRRAAVLVVCLTAFMTGVIFVWIDDMNRLTPVCLAAADESTAQMLGPAGIAALSTFCGGGGSVEGTEDDANGKDLDADRADSLAVVGTLDGG